MLLTSSICLLQLGVSDSAPAQVIDFTFNDLLPASEQALDVQTGDDVVITLAPESSRKFDIRRVTAEVPCVQHTDDEECDGILFWRTCHKIDKPQHVSKTRTQAIDVFVGLIPVFAYSGTTHQTSSLTVSQEGLHFVVPAAGRISPVRLTVSPNDLDPRRASPSLTEEERNWFKAQHEEICREKGLDKGDGDIVAKSTSPLPVRKTQFRLSVFRSR